VRTRMRARGMDGLQNTKPTALALALRKKEFEREREKENYNYRPRVVLGAGCCTADEMMIIMIMMPTMM